MLEITDLVLDYPGFSARYDLKVPPGALCAVIGPSGGGKTTLLHAIAGFERPSSGTLRFDGQDLRDLEPAARPVSILFQDHNLFPHLDVVSNVALGLKPSLRLDEAERQRVESALVEVDLAGFQTRMPAGLSGGQRQRVALARALLRGKPLMLLDEPFGALDPGLRRDMIGRVDALRRRHGLTVLMTIHTPEEIAQQADLFAFVSQGRVSPVGPWGEVTGAAAVRRFLGWKRES